jgi:hypothetical protein
LILGEFAALNFIDEITTRRPYFSPEILYNLRRSDSKDKLLKYKFSSDIFCLGLTLLEACTLESSKDLMDLEK